MKLDKITIRNFRGFIEERSFDFDPKMNVVLGDNTSGKTTLLHAVQIALGAYFQALNLIPGGKYFSRNFQSNDHVRVYSGASKSFLPALEKPSIEVQAHVLQHTYNLMKGTHDQHGKSISWRRIGNKISYRTCGELMDEVSHMSTCRRNADTTGINSILPLMISFSSARLEKNYNGAQKTKVRQTREEKAYKCALNDLVDFKEAFDWIYRYEKSLERGQEFECTDLAFKKALLTAIPALKEIHIDHKNKELFARLQMPETDKVEWLTYDMMSDGFKAMINIVSEIGYRCIALNGFLGAEAISQTPGVVLIDEIDLFLHPKWQRVVLQHLQQAFPQMQFIVTTHSPFIVQSVESHNVITLDGIQGYNDPNKRSIEEIVVSEMNLDTPRSAKYVKMVNLAERYYQLVSLDLENGVEAQEVKQELDDMESEFSDDPAYVALLKAERRSR